MDGHGFGSRHVLETPDQVVAIRDEDLARAVLLVGCSSRNARLTGSSTPYARGDVGPTRERQETTRMCGGADRSEQPGLCSSSGSARREGAYNGWTPVLDTGLWRTFPQDLVCRYPMALGPFGWTGLRDCPSKGVGESRCEVDVPVE